MAEGDKDTFSGAAEHDQAVRRAGDDRREAPRRADARVRDRARAVRRADRATSDRPITLASRVATDDDIRDKLREAIEDLRSASDRLQGKRERSSGARLDAARRRHRARDPLQPGDRAGDAALHPRPRLVGRRARSGHGATARTAAASHRAPGRRARRSEAGSSPSAVEMSARSRRARRPGSGAVIVPGTLGAQPVATGKATLDDVPPAWPGRGRGRRRLGAEEEQRDRVHLELRGGSARRGRCRCRP